MSHRDYESSTSTSGGQANAGHLLELDVDGKVEGREVAADGVVLDGHVANVLKHLPAGTAEGQLLYFNGTAWDMVTPGQDGELLRSNGTGNAPSWSTSSSAVPRFWSVPFSNQAGTPYTQVSSNTYELVSQFIWAGSDEVDILKKIYLTLELAGGSDASARVYDITNGQTVCEVTGFTTETMTLVDMGTLSNMSASPAIWEIQLLANGGGKKIRSSSFAGVF